MDNTQEEHIMKRLFLAVLLLFASPAFAAEEPDHAIHEELRALLQGIEQAVNTEKYQDLAQYFTENMRVTTINQEVITSRTDIEPYFRKWFGPGGYLKKLDMKLTADAPTELYGNKTFGIVRGSGNENYRLSDTRYFEMKTRWTATVIKDTDGKWRILALHIGTDFLDNPILAKAKGSIMSSLAGGLIAGLVIGGGLAFWLGRRKKAA
jgi:ketosteroid isomerase-like protein